MKISWKNVGTSPTLQIGYIFLVYILISMKIAKLALLLSVLVLFSHGRLVGGEVAQATPAAPRLDVRIVNGRTVQKLPDQLGWGVGGQDPRASQAKTSGGNQGVAVLAQSFPASGSEFFILSGAWGSVSKAYYVFGGYYICGAEMQFEKFQGSGKKDDDTATNGFRWRFCKYPNWNDQQDMEFSGYWGDWRGMQMCPQGYYVNGFDAKIEDDQHSGDDTSMGGLMLRCRHPVSGHQMDLIIFEGPWGGFKGRKGSTYTNYYFYAVEMIWQDQQGTGDDTAMNGLIFYAKNLQ